jgi:phage terminase small subunit
MLTAKQQRFVEEYLAGRNGTKAAIRSGYSSKTACAIASENLKKPNISAAIARRTAARRRRFDTDAERVIKELRRIAFADISGIFDERGRIKNPDDWPRETWDGIESVRYSERLALGHDGKPQRVSYRVVIRRKDSLRALEALAECWGLNIERTRPAEWRDRVIIARS